MELSGSDASSAMTFGSDAEMPEDPVEEPIYLGRKREKFYKVIIERGEGIDKPGTIDEVIIRYCEFSEVLSEKPFNTLRLGEKALPDYLEKGVISMKMGEIADFHVPEAMTETEPIIVKVELASFTNIHDLHANGMLIKKVLQKSSEITRISNKDEVIISMRIFQAEEVLFKNSELELIVGVTPMSEGVYEILRTMKLHEKSEVTVKFEYFKEKFQYEMVAEISPIVEIEVKTLDKLTDIYVNSGFYKKVLTKGTAETPYPNSQVEFEYCLKSVAGVIEGKAVVYLDESAIPSVWEDTLKLMKVGEHAELFCFPNEKSENLRDGLNEKFNCFDDSPVLYLTFISLLSGGPVYEMEEPEKLELAKRMKNVGSELFKKEKFLRAIEKYDNGLGALNPVKDHLDLYKDTYFSLQLNVALSFYKLKDFQKCIIRCDRVLETDPTEHRAIYRKGMAFKMSFEYQQAIEQFEAGKKIAESKNLKNIVKDFEKEITLVASHIGAYHKKEKKIYANLFK